jgi:hypothetical protein
MDPDLDPAIFAIDHQVANTKQILKKMFFCLLPFEGIFTSFFEDKKSKKEAQNSRNKGFSYYFCLMIKGSGSESESITLTNGSGSGSRRPKNKRIRRIRIQIRIRNTLYQLTDM